MSYVNMMASDRWSEADHVAKTEALVREHWSVADEAILNRKVLGAAVGQYVMNTQDAADLADFKAVTEAAQIAGMGARMDAAQLNAALDIEEAADRLAAVPPAPQPDQASPDAELPPDPYAQERADAAASHQALVDAASAEVTQLVADRQAWRDAQNPQPPDPPADTDRTAVPA